MTDIADPRQFIGRTAVDSQGNKIGKIEQIYLDDESGTPQWVTLKTGMFGTRESFAPLHGSRPNGDDLQLAVTKDLVKDAPNMDADGHLGDSENDALYAHYAGHLGSEGGNDRVSGDQDRDPSNGDLSNGNLSNGDPSNGDDATSRDGAVGHDTSGPNTDNAMTRSEEQLNVGTEKVEGGRARLRKYVVTEDVSTTVPVSHEEVRIEREPITDVNRDDALSGGDITEEEHEVTLHAERPIVSKETVPVERVRMDTETVTETHTVNEQVRKEQIDTPDLDQR